MPGVYQYYDSNHKLLYVGKAKNLKKRIKTYFKIIEIESFVESSGLDSNKSQEKVTKIITYEILPNPKNSLRIQQMVRQISSIHTIIVDNEKEALILENSFIKTQNPKYNILLRDDKTYPYITINLGDDFPRFSITRVIKKTKNVLYFGPYPKGAKEILSSIYEMFPLVQESSCLKGKKTCLYFQLNKCLGVCEYKDSATREKYANYVQNALNLMQNKAKMLKVLESKMLEYAQNELFEQALACKNSLAVLKEIEHFSVIDLKNGYNAEVLSFIYGQKGGILLKLFVRDGKVASSYHIFVRANIGVSKEDSKKLENIESRFYKNTEFTNLESKNLDSKENLENLELDSKKVIESNNIDSIKNNENLESNLQDSKKLENIESNNISPTHHPISVESNLQKSQHFIESNSNFSNLTQEFECEIYTQALLKILQDESLSNEIIIANISEKNFQTLQDSIPEIAERLVFPKKGNKLKLAQLANLNAQNLLENHYKINRLENAVLHEIKELFNLKQDIDSIEVFDTSHHSGSFCVGAMISYENNNFCKEKYRHYNLQGKDEYSQMREMLSRRAASFSKEPPPNLWLLDGGKAQINLAKEILESVGANVEVLAIAKEKRDAKAYRAKGRAKDTLRSSDLEVRLSESDKRLQFLQKLRDEAHRFAITFHRHQKKRNILKNI
nr:excinuclease ABC subunit UvrC [Helicobacter saguini]